MATFQEILAQISGTPLNEPLSFDFTPTRPPGGEITAAPADPHFFPTSPRTPGTEIETFVPPPPPPPELFPTGPELIPPTFFPGFDELIEFLNNFALNPPQVNIPQPGVSGITSGLLDELLAQFRGQVAGGSFEAPAFETARTDVINQLTPQLLEEALRNLANPSAFDDELFTRALSLAEGRLDERFDARREGLESELGSRGLAFSSTAGGALSDLEVEAGRAFEDIMTQLLLTRATTLAQDRQVAFGNALNLGGFEAGLAGQDNATRIALAELSSRLAGTQAGIGSNLLSQSAGIDQQNFSNAFQVAGFENTLNQQEFLNALGLGEFGEGVASRIFNQLTQQQGFLAGREDVGFQQAMQTFLAEAGLEQNAINDFLRVLEAALNAGLNPLGFDAIADAGNIFGDAASTLGQLSAAELQSLAALGSLLPLIFPGLGSQSDIERLIAERIDELIGEGDDSIPDAPDPIPEPDPPDIDEDIDDPFEEEGFA